MAETRLVASERRRKGLKAGGTILAMGCAAILLWAMNRPGRHIQASPLLAAAAAPTSTPKAAEPSPAPSQPQATSPPQAPAIPAQPAKAAKQVPRLDLVIDHLADTRGSVEPCG